MDSLILEIGRAKGIYRCLSGPERSGAYTEFTKFTALIEAKTLSIKYDSLSVVI